MYVLTLSLGLQHQHLESVFIYHYDRADHVQ